MKVEVKFGDWIQKGIDLWKLNLGVLVVASAITIVLSAVTVGVLAGPLLVGMILMVLRLHDRREPKPQAGDIFEGFKFFLPAFLVWLAQVVTIVITYFLSSLFCIGSLLGYFIQFVVGTALMFSLFLVAEKNADVVPAIQGSIDIVKTNFWPFMGFYIVTSLLAGIGFFLCFLPGILTMPLGICIFAVAYRDVVVSSATPTS